MSGQKLEPMVLFCDYNQYWCPLANLYWSQTSKVLVSRHVRSSLEEIISIFCPQCLTRYSEDEVTNYMGRCPSCSLCPCCEATLTPFTTENLAVVLQCATCAWRSDESFLSAATKSELDMLILKHEKEGISKTAFDIMLSKHLKAENNLKARTLTNNSASTFPRETSSSTRSKGVWQLKDLEAQMEETVRKYQLPEKYTFEKFVPELTLLSEKQRIAISEVQSASELATTDQKFRNLNASPTPVLRRCELFPNRVQLRTKRTLRCLRDVDSSGRMRLLVQSKVFPTEGDSSERNIRGKWWAIDSSAVHQIPFLSILRLPSLGALLTQEQQQHEGRYAYLDISITNALEADIVWSFAESTVEATAVETEQSTPSQQQAEPYYLLNQFDKPIDTTNHIVLSAAPLPEKESTSSSSSVEEDPSLEGGPSGLPTLPPVHTGRRLDISIGSYEDELLKDADDDEQTSATAAKDKGANKTGDSAAIVDSIASSSTGGSTAESRPAWTVRVDQNIAYVRIPVRVSNLSVLSNGDAKSTHRFELKLNVFMTQGSESSVSLPVRIVF